MFYAIAHPDIITMRVLVPGMWLTAVLYSKKMMEASASLQILLTVLVLVILGISFIKAGKVGAESLFEGSDDE